MLLESKCKGQQKSDGNFKSVIFPLERPANNWKAGKAVLTQIHSDRPQLPLATRAAEIYRRSHEGRWQAGGHEGRRFHRLSTTTGLDVNQISADFRV